MSEAEHDLRSAAIQADRSGLPDPQAKGAWRALADTEFSLLDCFDHDGRRYFVARLDGSTAVCSAREREVLAYVARGLTNKEIAFALGVAPSTVSSHLNNAMRRLGVRDRWILAELLFVARFEEQRCMELA